MGDVYVFRNPGGQQLAKRTYGLPPTAMAVAADSERVALTVGGQLEIRSVEDLTEIESYPWAWMSVQWLSPRFLIGAISDARIQIGDVQTGEIVAEIATGSWVRSMHYVESRGIALVTTQDRALVLRIALPD